jgi:hypothetical protein
MRSLHIFFVDHVVHDPISRPVAEPHEFGDATSPAKDGIANFANIRSERRAAHFAEFG